MLNVIDLDRERRKRWAALPRITKPGPAIESNGTRWEVEQIWRESGSALCRKTGGRARFAIPLGVLREAP